MLARGPPSVYVYFSPQNYLRRSILNRIPVGHRAPNPTFRRWQSAAAGQIDVEHIEEPDTRSDEKPQRQRRSRPSHDYKRWHPSTDLGVSTLGKPADILVIPSRDRKIRKAPKTEGVGQTTSTLQEKLDSENAPLDAKQLNENIEQARSLLDKRRGQLEKHEWKTLRTQLKRGFKTEQLVDYVRLNKPNFDPSEWPKAPEKDKVVSYLVEEVWGFTIPIKNASPALPTRKVKQSTVSLRLRTSHQLDHLLQHPAQPLKKVAEEFGVQVDIARSGLRIKISGPAAGQLVAAARGKLLPVVNAIRSVTIPMKGLLGLIPQDRDINDYLDECLPLLQQRHPGVTISREEKKLTFTHSANPRGADQVRRDILLSFPPPDNAKSHVIWPHLDKSEAVLQPFPAPRELPLSLRGLEWLRLVSSTATPQTSTSVSCRSSFDAIMQGLRETFDLSSAAYPTDHRANPYSEVIANFGQALSQVPSQPVERDARGKNLEGNNVSPDISVETLPVTEKDRRQERLESSLVLGTRVFDAGIPFLSQNLAKMDCWTEKSKTAVGDIPEEARVVLRLELSPTSTTPNLPSFELFVVVAHNTHPGKEEQLMLKIARISAILNEEFVTVACPHSEADVNFTRRLKQDLLYPGFLGRLDLKTLNSALCSYIDHARPSDPSGRSDWVFQPFASLHIPDSLRYAGKASPHESERDPSTEEKSEKVKDKSTEYILRTVDVVDVDSRHFSTHPTRTDRKKHFSPSSNLCLEHITYTGADALRQELRLAQNPMLNAPSQEQMHLPTFVKAALTLAERLSANPLKPEQKPASLAEQIDTDNFEWAQQQTGNAAAVAAAPPPKSRRTSPHRSVEVKPSTRETKLLTTEPTTFPKRKPKKRKYWNVSTDMLYNPNHKHKPKPKPKPESAAQTIRRLSISGPGSP